MDSLPVCSVCKSCVEMSGVSDFKNSFFNFAQKIGDDAKNIIDFIAGTR